MIFSETALYCYRFVRPPHRPVNPDKNIKTTAAVTEKEVISMKKLLAIIVSAAMLFGVCSVSMADETDIEAVLAKLLEEHPNLAYVLGYAEGAIDSTAAETEALAGAPVCVCENCQNPLCGINGCCGNCGNCAACENSTEGLDLINGTLSENTFLGDLLPAELLSSLAGLFGTDATKSETADDVEDRCIDCDLTALASSFFSLINPTGIEGVTLADLGSSLHDLLAAEGSSLLSALEGLGKSFDIGSLLRNLFNGENGVPETSAFSSSWSSSYSSADGKNAKYNEDSDLSYLLPNGRWYHINRTANEKPGSEKTSYESGQI